MREIKFRAWDPVLHHWDSHPCNGIDFNGKLWFGNADIDGYPLILEQFTGLKDENGKEIYEGDIVQTYLLEMKHKGPVLRIEYKDRSFAMVQDENDEGGCWYHIVEVIGNIHENPELLKEAN